LIVIAAALYELLEVADDITVVPIWIFESHVLIELSNIAPPANLNIDIKVMKEIIID